MDNNNSNNNNRKKRNLFNNSFTQLLPHISIIFSVVMMTLFIVDMVNQSLHIIDNTMAKWMLCILCLSSFVSSLLLCGYQYRDQ